MRKVSPLAETELCGGIYLLETVQEGLDAVLVFGSFLIVGRIYIKDNGDSQTYCGDIVPVHLSSDSVSYETRA
jgi:hypothetical protein